LARRPIVIPLVRVIDASTSAMRRRTAAHSVSRPSVRLTRINARARKRPRIIRRHPRP
jgi:hypothetical protein